MEETKKTKSIALERKLECYPPPKYHNLMMGYKELNEISKSEAVTEAIKQFFDNMPENTRRACLNAGIQSKHHY